MEYLNPHSIPGRVNRVTWDLLVEIPLGLFQRVSLIRKLWVAE
jgi:hypothetical protein